MGRGEGRSVYRGARMTVVENGRGELVVSVAVKARRSGWDDYELVMPRFRVADDVDGLVDIFRSALEEYVRLEGEGLPGID